MGCPRCHSPQVWDGEALVCPKCGHKGIERVMPLDEALKQNEELRERVAELEKFIEQKGCSPPAYEGY